MEPINELRAQIQQLLTRQTALENQAARSGRPLQDTVQYQDIITAIQSGDQIQLESYRAIPDFNGDKNQYRSWRNQVSRRMNMIGELKTHPKYEAALGIIRSKITGPASDVLTNNKTAYNIDAILNRLDTTYTDQRPLYIVEAEMTSLKQNNKSLQEFHDEINSALNLVISKIVLTYNTVEEQKVLVEEAQQKAIRTFIIGLRSNATRQILYSQNPMTLATALATAQTVYYDNQYVHLDQNREAVRQKQPNFQKNVQNIGPQQIRRFPTEFKVNMNCNQPQQQPFQPRAFKNEQMEMDNSNRFGQPSQWRQPYAQPNTLVNGPQQRELNSTRPQQPNKIQRINQLADDEDDPSNGYEGDMTNTIPGDAISDAANEINLSSIFLDE